MVQHFAQHFAQFGGRAAVGHSLLIAEVLGHLPGGEGSSGNNLIQRSQQGRRLRFSRRGITSLQKVEPRLNQDNRVRQKGYLADFNGSPGSQVVHKKRFGIK